MPRLRHIARLALSTTLALSLTTFDARIAPIRADDATATYQNPKAPLEERVNDLFGRLTADEKMALLGGTGFETRAIPRLGLPEMPMADAGQGVRGGHRGMEGPATLFPAGVTMAATWDPALVGQVARAIGEETRNKGTGAEILLGPDVNIHRSPLGGRNGESFSEDPYLSARMAVGYIEGMQSSGAAACIKHYACNNEEIDRGQVDVRVDERTLREIYLPSFEAGVTEAHSWSLMSSYNQVNGFHSSMNRYLLTDVLKQGWNWDGMVMSDWGGVHETAGTVASGNDLEMPDGQYLTPKTLTAALAAGTVTQAEIDDSVRRILRTAIRVGLLNGPLPSPDHANVGSSAHQKIAYQAAVAGITLLKNKNEVLPLDATKIKSIAIIGPRARDWQMGAYGSPYVDPTTHVGPMDGIAKRAGAGIALHFAQGTTIIGGGGHAVPASALTTASGEPGLKAEYFTNPNLEGVPALTRTDKNIDWNWNRVSPNPGFPRDNFSVRWTGKITAPESGPYMIALRADDGCRLYLDGKLLIDHWEPSTGPVLFTRLTMAKGEMHDLRVEYNQGTGEAYVHLNWLAPGPKIFADAVAAAKASDVALVFAGSSDEAEGADRPSMDLPDEQDDLIRAVAAANPRTIVVLNNGTPVTMKTWLGTVPGVVEAWFPGEMGGDALASVLFGDVNPSGKLPDTLAANRSDYPDYGNFPGVKDVVHYAEGIYVGYRHFDKKGIAPLFPFGYGLSYTTFKYANLKLSKSTLTGAAGNITATAQITNTGKRAGAEVVELYVHDPSPKIDKPLRELKGFQKVMLQPGETKTVTFTLDGRSFAYCDVPGKRWKADKGAYTIEVGASSRDIRQTATIRLPIDWTKSIPFMR